MSEHTSPPVHPLRARLRDELLDVREHTTAMQHHTDRDRLSAAFYDQCRGAYIAVLSGPVIGSREEHRDAFASTAREILTPLIVEYDSTPRGDMRRGELRGLINEYTPIALLSGPFSPKEPVVFLGSRRDDRGRKTDLFHDGRGRDILPIQVKTEDNATPYDVPVGGVLIQSSDFRNQAMGVTRLLVKKYRSRDETQHLTTVARELEWYIEERRRHPAKQQEILRERKRNYRHRLPLTYRVGETARQLQAFRDTIGGQTDNDAQT